MPTASGVPDLSSGLIQEVGVAILAQDRFSETMNAFITLMDRVTTAMAGTPASQMTSSFSALAASMRDVTSAGRGITEAVARSTAVLATQVETTQEAVATIQEQTAANTQLVSSEAQKTAAIRGTADAQKQAVITAEQLVRRTGALARQGAAGRSLAEGRALEAGAAITAAQPLTAGRPELTDRLAVAELKLTQIRQRMKEAADAEAAATLKTASATAIGTAATKAATAAEAERIYTIRLTRQAQEASFFATAGRGRTPWPMLGGPEYTGVVGRAARSFMNLQKDITASIGSPAVMDAIRKPTDVFMRETAKMATATAVRRKIVADYGDDYRQMEEQNAAVASRTAAQEQRAVDQRVAALKAANTAVRAFRASLGAVKTGGTEAMPFAARKAGEAQEAIATARMIPGMALGQMEELNALEAERNGLLKQQDKLLRERAAATQQAGAAAAASVKTEAILYRDLARAVNEAVAASKNFAMGPEAAAETRRRTETAKLRMKEYADATQGSEEATQKLRLQQERLNHALRNTSAGTEGASKSANAGIRSLTRFAMTGLILTDTMEDLGVVSSSMRIGLLLFFAIINGGVGKMGWVVVAIGMLVAAILYLEGATKRATKAASEAFDAFMQLGRAKAGGPELFGIGSAVAAEMDFAEKELLKALDKHRNALRRYEQGMMPQPGFGQRLWRALGLLWQSPMAAFNPTKSMQLMRQMSVIPVENMGQAARAREQIQKSATDLGKAAERVEKVEEGINSALERQKALRSEILDQQRELAETFADIFGKAGDYSAAKNAYRQVYEYANQKAEEAHRKQIKDAQQRMEEGRKFSSARDLPKVRATFQTDVKLADEQLNNARLANRLALAAALVRLDEEEVDNARQRSERILQLEQDLLSKRAAAAQAAAQQRFEWGDIEGGVGLLREAQEIEDTRIRQATVAKKKLAETAQERVLIDQIAEYEILANHNAFFEAEYQAYQQYTEKLVSAAKDRAADLEAAGQRAEEEGKLYKARAFYEESTRIQVRAMEVGRDQIMEIEGMTALGRIAIWNQTNAAIIEIDKRLKERLAGLSKQEVKMFKLGKADMAQFAVQASLIIGNSFEDAMRGEMAWAKTAAISVIRTFADVATAQLAIYAYQEAAKGNWWAVGRAAMYAVLIQGVASAAIGAMTRQRDALQREQAAASSAGGGGYSTVGQNWNLEDYVRNRSIQHQQDMYAAQSIVRNAGMGGGVPQISQDFRFSPEIHVTVNGDASDETRDKWWNDTKQKLDEYNTEWVARQKRTGAMR